MKHSLIHLFFILELDRENKENRNDIKVAPSTSKPADNTTTDSDFTLGLSEDMTSDLTSPQVKDVTSDLTLPQVEDVTSDLTLPQVKDVTSDLTLPQVKDVTSELHVSKDVDFTIPKVKDVNSELTKVATADTTSPEVRDRSSGDLTLPLTRPLHNSTRCDLTDDPVSTQSVTFDLLNDWDDEDDLFRSLQDGTETTDGTVNKDTLETIGCQLTQKASDQRSRPSEASVSRADVDQSGPALPSMDTSLLVTGDLSTAGSTWVRSAAVGEEGQVRSAGVGEEGQVEGAQGGPTGSEWTRGASVKASGGDKMQVGGTVVRILPGCEFRPPLEKMLFPVQRPGESMRADWDLFFYHYYFLTKKKKRFCGHPLYSNSLFVY